MNMNAKTIDTLHTHTHTICLVNNKKNVIRSIDKKIVIKA